MKRIGMLISIIVIIAVVITGCDEISNSFFNSKNQPSAEKVQDENNKNVEKEVEEKKEKVEQQEEQLRAEQEKDVQVNNVKVDISNEENENENKQEEKKEQLKENESKEKIVDEPVPTASVIPIKEDQETEVVKEYEKETKTEPVEVKETQIDENVRDEDLLKKGFAVGGEEYDIRCIFSKNENLKAGDKITILAESLLEDDSLESVTYTFTNDMGEVISFNMINCTSKRQMYTYEIPKHTGKLNVDIVVKTINGSFMAYYYTYDVYMPVVAITIDDGPTAYTDEFLDVLEEYDAQATFFEIGSSIGKHEDDLKRAVYLGCQIGTHTYSHATLTKLSSKKIADEMKKGAEAIYKATGVYPTVCRFPGGGGANNKKVLDAAGYPSIYWTIDTRDWESKNAKKVMQNIKNAKDLDGSIILIHSTHKSTLEAFKEMVPYLINQGYELVTIDRMANLKGITLEAGKNYSKLK